MNDIKCTVESCVHHCAKDSCNAKEIKVGKTSNEAPCECCQTECDSFEAKK